MCFCNCHYFQVEVVLITPRLNIAHRLASSEVLKSSMAELAERYPDKKANSGSDMRRVMQDKI